MNSNDLNPIDIDNYKEKESPKKNALMTKNFSNNISGETGIKNDLYENNCYINVCIQSIYHFRLLRFNLLSTQQFPLFSNSPKIITELVLLISAYKQSLKSSQNNILDPNKFCDALDEYFKDKKEFQKNQQNDPIELLNILFTFIHTYIVSNFNTIGFSEKECYNKCFIHQLFFIKLKEKSFCSNCKLNKEIKYDNNNFMFLINVNNIIETSNQYFPEFINFKERFIQCFNYGKKICSKCNTNNFTSQFFCLHLGYYLIINLSWENNYIDLVILLKFLCMINSGFSSKELFIMKNEEKIMKFLGLILFSSHHYVMLCYNKKNDNFVIYDDSTIKIFPNWKNTIEYLIGNRYLPIAIFYEAQNDSQENKCKFNISESFYLKKYNECIKKDEENKKYKNYNKTSNQLIIGKLKDGEWECDNCNSINPPNNALCKCGYKNEIIEKIILQDLRNQNNYNDLNYNNKNNNMDIYNYKNNNNDLINNLSINKEKENSTKSSDSNPFSIGSKIQKESNENLNQISELLPMLNLKKILNNETEINKEKPDWKCPVCKILNKADKNKCKNCGRRNNGININFWKCENCQNDNPLSNKKCSKCRKENNILQMKEKIMKKSLISSKRYEEEDYNKNNNVININASPIYDEKIYETKEL
jgi:hypothetical protein